MNLITPSEQYYFEMSAKMDIDKEAYNQLMWDQDEIDETEFVQRAREILGYCIYS